jgi:hypothetical protein
MVPVDYSRLAKSGDQGYPLRDCPGIGLPQVEAQPIAEVIFDAQVQVEVVDFVGFASAKAAFQPGGGDARIGR